MVSCIKHDYGSMTDTCCPSCLQEQLNLFINNYIKLSSSVEPQIKPVSSKLDLDELARKVDEQLAKETPESLSLWFYKHRLFEIYYNLKDSPLEEKYKQQFKTFIDGIDNYSEI